MNSSEERGKEDEQRGLKVHALDLFAHGPGERLTGVGAERPAEMKSAVVPLGRSAASSSATAAACGEDEASDVPVRVRAQGGEGGDGTGGFRWKGRLLFIATGGVPADPLRARSPRRFPRGGVTVHRNRVHGCHLLR